MNGFIRRRLCSLHVQCRHNAFSKPNKTSPISCQENRRQFSSEDDTNKKDVYIPKRIQRRLKEKNLKAEDYEIVPVLKEKSKPDSFERLLDDATISAKESMLNAEFPSDVDLQITGGLITDVVSESKVKLKAKRPKQYVNPKDRTVLLFPGQGSQMVGMGRKLLPYPGVTELYQKASEILGYDLLNLCLNGPKTELDKTEFCQPALFVTSLAGVERLKEDIPEAHENCRVAAGFSLGEITALVYSGAISFEDGLRFVMLRAKCMQQASEMVSSGMMTVFSDRRTQLSEAIEVAKEYCRSEIGMAAPVLIVANYLCTEVKTVAGHEEALQFLEKYSQDFRIIRTKRLPVSGAFHTPLMRDRESLIKIKEALTDMEITVPSPVQVYTCITGEKYYTEKHIRVNLYKSIYKPVRWEQVVQKIYNRPLGTPFPTTYEVGPRNELGILLKQINLKAYASYKHIHV